MRLVLLICLLFSCLRADDTKSKIVVLSSNEVVTGDYFTWGSTVELSGTVQGDVYVCGGNIIIDGTVEGDVLAAAGTVLIAGTVKGNLRIIGGQVAVRGAIGRNCTVVAGALQLLPSASVGGSVVGVCGSADISAPIGKDVTLAVGSARLSSMIGRDVEAHIGKLRLTGSAIVEGKIDYTSSEEAVVDPQAQVGGRIERHATVVQNLTSGKWVERFFLGTKVVGLLMNFIYSLVIGWLMLKVFPDKVEKGISILRSRPWKAFGYGLFVLLLVPLAFLVLIITIFGIPFALMLLALNVAAFYSAKIVSVLALTSHAFKGLRWQPSRLGALAIGLACYFIVTEIPFVGSAVTVCALLFGIGAGVLASIPSKRA